VSRDYAIGSMTGAPDKGHWHWIAEVIPIATKLSRKPDANVPDACGPQAERRRRFSSSDSAANSRRTSTWAGYDFLMMLVTMTTPV